jgi:hypothetical protein
MKIPAWKEALQGKGLLPMFQDVLDRLMHGFNQGIPAHTVQDLPFFMPSNHESAYKACKKIEKSFKEEIAAHQMYGPFSQRERFTFFRKSPLGAVVNGNGSVRPINNLSYPRSRKNKPSVNSYVQEKNFKMTWDDFQIVSSFLQQRKAPVKLSIFNWAKAYCQIPTAIYQWQYLMTLNFNSGMILDTRIAFGRVASCGSFVQIADT